MDEKQVEEWRDRLRRTWHSRHTETLCDLALQALRRAEPWQPIAPSTLLRAVAKVTESTGTMTVILALESNLPIGTMLYASPITPRRAEPWIPVGERLPARNANVLYWSRRGYPAIADEWHDEDHLTRGDATHWQPITPPEAEE